MRSLEATAPAAGRSPYRLTGRRRHPATVAVAGALFIASSATLVRLAGVAPATAATFRCGYALPPLALLAWRERRRLGPQPPGRLPRHVLAGALFAADLVLWHHAIATAGAGIATVLGNLQVVFVSLGAWAVFGERPAPRLLAALPVVLAGVVMISGVIGTGAYGSDPGLAVLYGAGTSVAYAGFIMVLRGRGEAGGRVVGPLLRVTAVTAVVSASVGPVSGGIDLVPSWPSAGWLALLALSSQVIGWLLITSAWRVLPAAQAALLLLIQPVASVVLAAAVLAERPSPWQLAGCAVVLAGVLGASLSRPAGPGQPADAAPGRSGQAAEPG